MKFFALVNAKFRMLKLIVVFLFFMVVDLKAQLDSIKYPRIAEIKKLPADELNEKKEGLYFTGVPDFSSDPLNGIGYGVEGTLFFNGKKTDPLFAYTPYRQKLELVFFNTTRNANEFALKLDVPYIWNTPWRLRTELVYEENPNLVYFGNSASSLRGLSYYPNGDSTGQLVNNGNYDDYEKSLIDSKQHYNDFIKTESVINVSLERSVLEGKARWLVGYEFAKFNNTTFINTATSISKSKLFEDAQNLGILGLGNGRVSMVQLGFVYDTRNLETDPSAGCFAEFTQEISMKSIGSQYDFVKTFVQFKGYKQILNKFFKKQIIAVRSGIGITSGKAPFFEYADEWSSEGSIEGLGGTNTLRGYKQSRFMAPLMNFNNIEWRSQFWTGSFLKQHIALSVVPFFDFGGCWDAVNKINLGNFRYNKGIGMRVAWNMNTILRFDYAVSKEDAQFFFQMNHAF